MSNLMKVCRVCAVEKPCDLFRKHSNMADGYLSKCRACEADTRRQRRGRLSAGVLRQALHYDPLTGDFTRLEAASNAKPGDRAGYVNDLGYVVVAVNGVQYHAHRLAWLYMTGDWPAAQIDHRDLDKGNNRWANLRLATPAQNGQNCRRRRHNTSSFKGVGWSKRHKKWRARVVVNGREISLGYFAEIEQAKAAYERAALEHFGEFARVA